MSRATLVAGVGVLVLSVIALVWIGGRVLARDRAAIHAEYADNKLRTLDTAAVELGNDVEKIGEDLELAAALMTRSTSPDERARALDTITTMTREYAAMELRDAAGATLVRVVAPDAVGDVLEQVGTALDETTRLARAHPGAFRSSGPLGPDGSDLAWYRVFARRSPSNDDLVVAVVVDMRSLLARLRLLEGANSALLVIGGHGRPAPSSHRLLAAQVRALDQGRASPGIARLMRHVRRRAPGTEMLGEHEARQLGLPAAAAVAVTLPVVIEDGEPWALVLVASTSQLRSQERAILRRLLAVGGAGGLLVLVLSTYFVHNARRAAALRERLRHVDRLAHLTEKAEKILDHIPSGVLALTADARVSGVNRWLSGRLGRDVRGLDVIAAFPALGSEHAGALRALLAKALADGVVQSLHRMELPLWGGHARVSLHAVPLERPLGDVHALLVIEDLEPLRPIEDRLLQSEKLVTAGQLAAGIAHEIGTPLNIIRARAELAMVRLGAGHAQAPDQQVIVDQIDHVSRLITQLLDYVRSAPRAEVAVVPATALAAVAELLAVEAGKRGVSIRVEATASTRKIRADPGQLQQVIVNLAVNALDACARGGVVTLRANPGDADPIVLEVEDDGVGIEPGSRGQVFDPFFTTKKRGQGTGLGLWVVAQLVRVHGAEIELASGAAGGTLVRLRWPAHPEAA